MNFNQTAVSPLNSELTLLDPVTNQPRQILGGLVFAGVNGAPTVQGNQPAVKMSPRLGAAYSINDKTVVRAGWGLYYVPYSYPAAAPPAGTDWLPATTNIQQTSPVPTISMSNPFPAASQPSGNSLGLHRRRRGSRAHDPEWAARRYATYSVDIQRELPGGVTVSAGVGLTDGI